MKPSVGFIDRQARTAAAGAGRFAAVWSALVRLERHTAFRLASFTALCAMSLYLVFAYASLGRPIWIDEFLHFAFGSEPSTAAAWTTIRATIRGVNFGQTGAYMIADYWLLKLFGASAFWLRLPSIASALFMALATVIFFHVRGFKAYWSLLALMALFCQHALMYYAGEARPYMPLAGASVGALAYYSISQAMRRTWWAFFLGLASILWGSLMHPYFAIYWAALACFTYWETREYSIGNVTPGSFFRHCNPTLSVIGIITYFSIGLATWMRSGRVLNLDPFFWISNDGLYKTFFDETHFEILAGHAAIAVVLFVATAIALSLSRQWRQGFLNQLISPLALIFLSLAISALLSFISYRNHYWILPRQWVASIALATIGLIWFLAALLEIVGNWSHVLQFFLVLLLAIGVVSRLVGAQELINAERTSWANQATPKMPLNTQAVPSNSDEWVALANANIASGGLVWPVFRKFYEK